MPDFDILDIEQEDGAAIGFPDASVIGVEATPQSVRRKKLAAEKAAFEAEKAKATIPKTALRGMLGMEAGFKAELPRQAGGLLVMLSRLAEPPTGPGAGALGPGSWEKPPDKGAIFQKAEKAGLEAIEGGKQIGGAYAELSGGVGGGEYGKMAESIGASSVSMLPVVPAAMVGGLPASAIVSGLQQGGSTFADAYDFYKQSNIPKDEALRKASNLAVVSGAITALVTAGFGKTGVEAEFKNIYGLKNWLAAGAKAFGMEGVEELTDQEYQTILSSLTFRPDMTPEEALEDLFQAAIAGGFITIPSTVTHAAAKLFPDQGTLRTIADKLRIHKESQLEVDEGEESWGESWEEDTLEPGEVHEKPKPPARLTVEDVKAVIEATKKKPSRYKKAVQELTGEGKQVREASPQELAEIAKDLLEALQKNQIVRKEETSHADTEQKAVEVPGGTEAGPVQEVAEGTSGQLPEAPPAEGEEKVPRRRKKARKEAAPQEAQSPLIAPAQVSEGAVTETPPAPVPVPTPVPAPSEPPAPPVPIPAPAEPPAPPAKKAAIKKTRKPAPSPVADAEEAVEKLPEAPTPPPAEAPAVVEPPPAKKLPAKKPPAKRKARFAFVGEESGFEPIPEIETDIPNLAIREATEQDRADLEADYPHHVGRVKAWMRIYPDGQRAIVLFPEHIGPNQYGPVLREDIAHVMFSTPEAQDVLADLADTFLTPEVISGLQEEGYVQEKDESDELYRTRLLEEYFARANQEAPSIWRTIIERARTWLVMRWPAIKLVRLSDAEIGRALARAARNVYMEKLRGAAGTPAGEEPGLESVAAPEEGEEPAPQEQKEGAAAAPAGEEEGAASQPQDRFALKPDEDYEERLKKKLEKQIELRDQLVKEHKELESKRQPIDEKSRKKLARINASIYSIKKKLDRSQIIKLPPDFGRTLTVLNRWLAEHHINSPGMSLSRKLLLVLKGVHDLAKKAGPMNAIRAGLYRSLQIMGEYFNNAPKEDDDFRAIIKEWFASDTYTGLEIKRFMQLIKSKVKDKIRREAITAWIQAGGDDSLLKLQMFCLTGKYHDIWRTATELTNSEKELARQISAEFDAKFPLLQKLGMVRGPLINYVPQLWAKVPDIKLEGKMPGGPPIETWKSKLDTRLPYFFHERHVESYFDGIMANGTPKTLDIAELVGMYNAAFFRFISSRAMVYALMNAEANDGKPIVAIGGRGISEKPKDYGDSHLFLINPDMPPKGSPESEDGRSYIPIDHPALRDWLFLKQIGNTAVVMKADFWVHPDYVKFLKNVLLPSPLRQNTVVRGLLAANRFFKHSKLAFAFFHLATEVEHALAHRINPLMNDFDLDLNDPIQYELVKAGLDLGMTDEIRYFMEGSSSKGGLLSVIPFVGKLNTAFADWLFNDYIPLLKMRMALHAFKRNLNRFGAQMTYEQIAELTAMQANAAFGSLNYRLMGRSDFVRDMLSLCFLAPDFLEARARFIAQAFTKYGTEQRAALALQAAVLYIFCRILNTLLDDDPHFEIENAFNVISGNRSFTLRTIIQDAMHFALEVESQAAGRPDEPPLFIINRMAPLVRIFMDAARRQDWRGIKRDNLEMFHDFLTWLAPVGIEPLVPGTKPERASWWHSPAKAIGLMSKQFSHSDEVRRLAVEFNKKFGGPAARRFEEQREKSTSAESPYAALAVYLDTMQLGKAKREYQKLLDAGFLPNEIEERFRHHLTRPFTGEKSRELAFKNWLAQKPGKEHLYDRAMAERQKRYSTFLRVVRE